MTTFRTEEHPLQRTLITTLFVAAACIAVGPLAAIAQASEAAATAAEPNAPSAEPERECRRVQETGSRVAKRVCRKPAEWRQLDNASRESIERGWEGSNRNTGADE